MVWRVHIGIRVLSFEASISNLWINQPTARWLLSRKRSLSDYMTRHNLGEHLIWLVTSNPSKPPLGPPILIEDICLNDRSDAPARRAQNSVPSVARNEEFPIGDGERNSGLQHLPCPPRAIITSDAETMARLQLAPSSSKKARLMLNQMILDPLLQTPRDPRGRMPDPAPIVGYEQGKMVPSQPSRQP